MTDEQTSKDAEDRLAQVVYSSIMSQLIESDRFRTFFHANYDLHKQVDEDLKTVSYLLVEVPPSVVQHRLVDSMNLAESLESPGIVAPTPSEISKIAKV